MKEASDKAKYEEARDEIEVMKYVESFQTLEQEIRENAREPKSVRFPVANCACSQNKTRSPKILVSVVRTFTLHSKCNFLSGRLTCFCKCVFFSTSFYQKNVEHRNQQRSETEGSSSTAGTADKRKATASERKSRIAQIR